MQLDEALAAFKTTRSSELTPAIETLGREALDGFVPPAPKKNMEFHRAWREIALEPAKRTWCLDTIIDKLPKLRDGKEHHFGDKMDAAVERLETLCTVEPDPRIARAMIALYELRSPVMGFVPAIEALARVLVRHADDQTASVPSIAELATEEEVERSSPQHHYRRQLRSTPRRKRRSSRSFRKRFEVVAVRPPSGTITGVK